MTGFEIAMLVSSIGGVINSLTQKEEEDWRPQQTAEDKWMEMRIKMGKALADRKKMVQTLASTLTPNSKPEDFSGGTKFQEEWGQYVNDTIGGDTYLGQVGQLKEQGKYDELGRIKDIYTDKKEYTVETKTGPSRDEPLSEDVTIPTNTRFISDETYPVKYESGQAVGTRTNWVDTYMYDEISGSYMKTGREERDMSKYFWSGKKWERHLGSGYYK